MATKRRGRRSSFDVERFLREAGPARAVLNLGKDERLFSQGDRADSVYYIQKGSIELTVLSHRGKQATLALLGPGNFVGEGCIAGAERIRTVSATAYSRSTLLRIEKNEMIRVLREQHALAERFVSFLLERNSRIQADLVDQLFNSSEKRLARVLLLLAHIGKDKAPETIAPNISHEMLAQMIGTTRSRVNFFMNRFRKLGYIDHNGGLEVHSSLLNVVLHE